MEKKQQQPYYSQILLFLLCIQRICLSLVRESPASIRGNGGGGEMRLSGQIQSKKQNGLLKRMNIY